MAPVSSLGSVVSWEEDDSDGEAKAVLGHSFIASGGWWCKRWGMKSILTLITILLLSACVSDGTESVDPVTGKILKENFK